ncbi:MAG: DUF5054 domain-containing protein [Opitutaceae bacterium]|jgi:hypothetical protein
MNSSPQEVTVVFKTHLDIGFTDLARKVVSRYHKDFIPAALALARKTRSSPNRFVWTTGSWLAYRYLADAGPQERKLMEEAIAEGDFHWHALPFTTHTELLDPSLFRLGLEFSRRLDERFGRKTIAAKMTDVPGHTLGMVPLLAEAGIRLLHLGVNPTSVVPSVPRVFRWQTGGSEVVVIYEESYGSTTRLPGGVGLCMNLTGDNLGPQDPRQIDKVYDQLRGRFPDARIKAGGLDPVAKTVWANRASLPVVTSEIGDTWIHGVGTDPQKVARFRALSRLRTTWINQGILVERQDVDLAFGEQLLLVAEHTWGMDIKKHLHDRKIWSPRRLRAALSAPNFRAVTASWREQRAYLDQAVAALPASLQAKARACPPPPPKPFRLTTSTRIGFGKPFTLGPWEMAIDDSGAISRLRQAGRIYADASHRLGALVYETFSAGDYERFYRQYCRLKTWWCVADFTKPGMRGSTSHRYRPRVHRIDLSKRHDSAQIALRFPAAAQRLGAPADVVLLVSARPEGLDMSLRWKGKPANRLPEALWFHLNPRLPEHTWSFEKMGFAVNPADVVKGGNRHLHAVTGPVTAADFSLTSPDAILIAPGTPRLLDFTRQKPRLNQGVTSVLYDNVWGTNFPMWSSEDACFRFGLGWTNAPATA